MNAIEISLVVALLGAAFTLGILVGVLAVDWLRRTQVAARDRRIAELEERLGGGPDGNGRWHG